MDAEHVMSGLAALRDTIALPELFGMVVESLGGEAASGQSHEEKENKCGPHQRWHDCCVTSEKRRGAWRGACGGGESGEAPAGVSGIAP